MLIQNAGKEAASSTSFSSIDPIQSPSINWVGGQALAGSTAVCATIQIPTQVSCVCEIEALAVDANPL